jgi:2-phosphosulfolactate phosphatase
MIPAMMPQLSIHLLPNTVERDRLDGSVAVMIDVLRASTTLIHALDAGCHCIKPCQDIATARQLACQPMLDADPPTRAPLLAGERDGVRIDGFDLDNSPAHFTPNAVSGRTIVFTTTNGTAALDACRNAELVLVAAFNNTRAIVQTLAHRRLDVHLVCAGTNGQVTAEDCLCAGAIGLALQELGHFDTLSCDATRIAIGLYQQVQNDPARLLNEIRESHGGRNLRQLGFDHDISLAAQRDTVDLVPTFDSHNNTISVLA